MVRYGLTVFLGAFLLFQIQPIAAKLLLPRFGGVASVWTTAMLFFQLVLLLGYSYVHLSHRFLSLRVGFLLQCVLLIIAAVTLPFGTERVLASSSSGDLAWPVAKSLGWMVGAVFLAVSTTGPLIQNWQAHSHPGRSPFRLYALSNAGSLAGLLAYPLLFEPNLGLRNQIWGWSGGFWGFALLMFVSGLQIWNSRQFVGPASSTIEVKRVKAIALLRWLLLTAIASAMLMSATNLLCQEVASFPFLWVLPLTAYLLTFMICFEKPGWYRRRPCFALLLVSGVASLLLFHLGTIASLVWHALAFTTVCFATGMICHGELERSKPGPGNLTLFFLMVALGGLIGSALIVLLMPHLLDRYFEFQAILLLSCLLGVASLLGGLWRRDRRFGWEAGAWLFSALFVIAAAASSVWTAIQADQTNGVLVRMRNDYGLVAISDNSEFREMINGQTRHGRQFHEAKRRMQPIDYYDPTSGVGIAFQYLHRTQADGSPRSPIRTGVIGLGGGVLSTWLKDGDQMCFYEVNPQVIQLASEYFSYLSQSAGETTVVAGDARIEMSRELEQGHRPLDLIVVDAFTSDSIPTHLLTRDCLGMYRKRLRTGGILAIHISNRYLNLLPVVADCGGDQAFRPYLFDRRTDEPGVQECTWVLLTDDPDLAKFEMVKTYQSAWPNVQPLIWTDDFNSVWPIIDWTFWIDWRSLGAGARAK